MKFVVFIDVAGTYSWHLVAGNGRIVATSCESFATRANAFRATNDVSAAFARGPLEIEFLDDPEAD